MPTFVVERFWPDVTADDMRSLTQRLRTAAADVAGVRYLGSVLLVGDDVVQCRFDAPDEAAVRAVNDAALARFDRLVRAAAYPP